MLIQLLAIIIFFFYTLLLAIFYSFGLGINNSFFFYFQIIFVFNFNRILILSFFLNIFLIIFFSCFNFIIPFFHIINDLFFYSTHAFCMESEVSSGSEERMSDISDIAIQEFPVQNINLTININPESSLRDLDGILQIVEEIYSENNFLLKESGSNNHLGVVTGMYYTPCTVLEREMLEITNSICNSVNYANLIEGLSVAHLLEYLEALNFQTNSLLSYSSRSFLKMNFFYVRELYGTLHSFDASLRLRDLDIIFAYPLISSFVYDFNMASFNNNTIHFYSFLSELRENINQSVEFLQNNSEDLEFEGSNLLLLNIVGELPPINRDVIILNGQQQNPDTLYLNIDLNSSIRTLEANNFVTERRIQN